MRQLTPRLAALMAGMVAVVVYVNALGNRWALDDHALVAGNPAAQSVPGAARAFFSPYWPTDEIGRSAGLYRPLTVLSFAVDWTVSNGHPSWFHATNIVLHALATILVVVVFLRWLSPGAAFAGGIVFAVHPVHVEAVANVIGRAEVLSSIGILSAVLAARRYRSEDNRATARLFAMAATAFALLAMLSKENGVVTIAVLLLDDVLERKPCRNGRLALYAPVLSVTLGWFFLWKSVAGGIAGFTVAPGIRWLTPLERLATALPVQLEAVRLLIWPFDLAASYDPAVIPQRLHLGSVAVLAAVVSFAIISLGVASARRAPGICFALLSAVIAFAPASNLVFPAGLMLGERTLYFSAIAPAFAAGWLMTIAPGPAKQRVAAAIAIVVLAYSVRTVSRNPFWMDMRTVITTDLLEHPEGFRSRIRIGEAFEATGDTTRAMQQYLTAAELFPPDPFVSGPIVRLATALDRPNLALSEATRAYGIAPFHTDIIAQYSRALLTFGAPDSALAVAAGGYRDYPGTGTAVVLQRTLTEIGAPEWRLRLAAVRVDWLSGRPISATRNLAAMRLAMPDSVASGAECEELRSARGILETLSPATDRKLSTALDSCRDR